MERHFIIDWAELRELHGGGQELYFVEAIETAKGWLLRDQSTYEVRSYDVASYPQRSPIAEHAKEKADKGRVNLYSILYLVSENRGASIEFKVCNDIDPGSSKRRATLERKIIVRFRIRKVCQLSLPSLLVYLGPGERAEQVLKAEKCTDDPVPCPAEVLSQATLPERLCA